MKTPIIALLMLLTLFAPAVADDHGDSPFAATPIAPDGTLISACIETAGDMDYFLFQATAGRTYRASTSHPTGGMDSLLYLIERNGQEILAIDDDSAGETNSRIVWTCTADGTYFLMVRHAQATLGTGCYGLSVSIALLDDHGNDLLAATPFAAGQTVAGFLEEAGDTDVFVLSADPGYQYSVSFAASSADEPLELIATRNGSLDPLLTLSSDASAESGTWTLPTAESVFFAVQSRSGDGIGGYTLAVERVGYADDHGNSAIDATPLSTAWRELFGRLEVAGDTDWFTWEASDDAEYTFVVGPTDGMPGLRATIRGPDGQALHETVPSARDESFEIAWRAPQSGTYYLEISSSDGIGGYQLNTSATLQLEAIGSFNPSGYSLDIVVDEDLAYLIVGTKGLLVLDVADPTSPFEIGSHSTNGYAQAVAVSGNTAYVANRSAGVTILDVSDPSRPTEIGTFDTPGSAQSIRVHGNLVLVADQRGGLRIARIQAGGTLVEISAVETNGFPIAADASGSLAVVAVGDAGVEIIDLSTPETPVTLARLDLAGDARDVVLRDGLAYVAAGYRGVRIVDLSEPTDPSEAGWIGTTGEAIGLLAQDGLLYVAEQAEGLSVYSLVDPPAPALVARIDTPGEATAIAVGDSIVLIADRQEGVLVVQLVQ